MHVVYMADLMNEKHLANKSGQLNKTNSYPLSMSSKDTVALSLTQPTMILTF